jgi:hypothetical protein
MSTTKNRWRSPSAFVEQIARMTSEYEIEGGMDGDDAVETVSRLIAEARELTGIDPEHPRYCVECLERLQVPGSLYCRKCE